MDELKYDIKDDDKEIEDIGKEAVHFMDALEGIADGDWDRVVGALEQAKTRLPDIILYARLRQRGVVRDAQPAKRPWIKPTLIRKERSAIIMSKIRPSPSEAQE